MRGYEIFGPSETITWQIEQEHAIGFAVVLQVQREKKLDTQNAARRNALGNTQPAHLRTASVLLI